MRAETVTLFALAAGGALFAQPQSPSPGPAGTSYARVSPPVTFTVEFLNEPPQLSQEQLAILERSLLNVNMAPPGGEQTTPVAGPTVPGTTPSSSPIAGANASTGGAAEARAGGQRLKVGTAESRGHVFYVGNGFAARSVSDSPDAWTFINPAATMSDFCCEQEVIADKKRDMLLWYRQGSYQAGSGQGRFTLGVSTDGGGSFCSYSVTPSSVSNSLTSRSWGSSNVALTSEYLYISADVHLVSGAFDRKIVLRWPLDMLQSCSGLEYLYVTHADRASLADQFIR